MVVIVAVVTFCAGLAAAAAMFRGAVRTLRRRRPGAKWTWKDWSGADPVGGALAPVVYVAAAAATLVGIYGYGAPGWVRAGLLGFMAGFCLPPFAFGCYLKLKEFDASKYRY